MRLTDRKGVEIVIEKRAQAPRCLARHGVIVTAGFSAGRTTTITQADLILRRGRIQGFGVCTSTPDEWREAWIMLTMLSDSGKVKPLFDRGFPFELARRRCDI